MKILVTAGNTQTPIDHVRCITNIFSGRTGTAIALAARRRGHDVHLLTSHPDLAGEAEQVRDDGCWSVSPFRTFDDLHALMENQITREGFDVIVHCAAVSDFQLAGIYTPSAGSTFDNQHCRWLDEGRMVDASAGKVKSQHSELWLRLVPTPKLVDRIRQPWGFCGVLVKFKLEVAVTERELAAIAVESRQHSDADLIVANSLEGMYDWALLGRREGQPQWIDRRRLADLLLDEIESISQRKAVARPTPATSLPVPVTEAAAAAS